MIRKMLFKVNAHAERTPGLFYKAIHARPSRRIA